jgi:outer membrane receptor protein involved in Fe transport
MKISLFNYYFSICSFSLLLLGTIVQKNLAQEKGALRGVVVDSASGEVLPFGNVLVQDLNIGASTNSAGYFYIPALPAKVSCTIKVSYVGYLTKYEKVYISSNKITEIKVKLVPTNIMMQSVEKIGGKTVEKNATDLGLERISSHSIEMFPKGVESDVFRTLQYIPGVQSTGDVSARYYVRGSPSNENLVLLNGVTVYNPFHAFGIFSVVDPDMINSVEFYKGGFPPEYGGRLASVLNIVTKDGNTNILRGSKFKLNYW